MMLNVCLISKPCIQRKTKFYFILLETLNSYLQLYISNHRKELCWFERLLDEQIVEFLRDNKFHI